MNKQKSNVYGNGMPKKILEQFAQLTGLKIGTLPFKYLGVPISGKKLSVLDCNILVERIVDRIRALGAKRLFYAGILVMINSVLGALHGYWARIYIIPSCIMAKIESIYRSFLWKGEATSQSPALVSWDKVCLPKNQGGVSWYDYKPSHGSSWAWRRICRIKEGLIAGYVGTGWLSEEGEYTIAKGYQWLGTGAPNVDVYKCVWNTIAIPEHPFIGWLYVQGRLLTKDRICRMNIGTDALCELCAPFHISISWTGGEGKGKLAAWMLWQKFYWF
ncbi:uncharacterized protein LOC141655621 [Silene latifolia]|uniref:uncharacterized protein LOC141655621 n=1 Tax=Silene latifolia TaxID=37657 RepID=UPI003D772352